jgi:hypothetical protein
LAANVEEVDADRFTSRLGKLFMCNLSGMPRRNVDRQILLKSAALSIGPLATPNEAQVDAVLQQWRSAMRLQLDHVAWRRQLVDAGYLQRDRARTAYAVSQPPEETTGVRFAPDVEEVVVVEVVDRVRREAGSRRMEYERSQEP